MIVQPRKYKSTFVHPVLTMECRQDKFGNLFYYVEFKKDGEPFGFAFQKMSSALDFINSNFNKQYYE